LPKYYADEAKIVWNGNEIEVQNRQAFHSDLPDSTHAVECFDVHPIFSNLKVYFSELLSKPFFII
jgi:hypothetical protein